MISTYARSRSFIGLSIVLALSSCKTTETTSAVQNNVGAVNYRIGQAVDTGSGIPAKNCLAEIEIGSYIISQDSTAKVLPSARLLMSVEELADVLENDSAFRLEPLSILDAIGYDGQVGTSPELRAIGRLPVGQYTPILAVTYSESKKFRTIRTVRLAKQYTDLLKEGRHEEFIRECGTGLVGAEEEGATFASFTLLDVWGKTDVPQDQAGSAKYQDLLREGLGALDPTAIYTKLDRYTNGDGSTAKQSVVLSFVQGQRPKFTEGKLTGQELSDLWSSFVKQRNEVWNSDRILSLTSTHPAANSEANPRPFSPEIQAPSSLKTVKNPPLIQPTINQRLQEAPAVPGAIEVSELATVPVASRIQMLMQKIQAAISDDDRLTQESVADLPVESSDKVFHRTFLGYAPLGAISLSEEHNASINTRRDFFKALVQVSLEHKGIWAATSYALGRSHQFEDLNTPSALKFFTDQLQDLEIIRTKLSDLYSLCQGVKASCDTVALEQIHQTLGNFKRPHQSNPIVYGQWEFCPVLQYMSRADPICGVATFASCRHPDFGIESFNSGNGQVCGVDQYFENHDCRRCGQKPNFGSCRKCRHPAHGVESWKSCLHESFGVALYQYGTGPQCGTATYKVCNHPSFGVARRQDCPKAKF